MSESFVREFCGGMGINFTQVQEPNPNFFSFAQKNEKKQIELSIDFNGKAVNLITNYCSVFINFNFIKNSKMMSEYYRVFKNFSANKHYQELKSLDLLFQDFCVLNKINPSEFRFNKNKSCWEHNKKDIALYYEHNRIYLYAKYLSIFEVEFVVAQEKKDYVLKAGWRIIQSLFEHAS